MPIKSTIKHLQTRKLTDEGEGLMRRLADSGGTVPWEFDLATRCFTHVGPQAVQLLGYPIEHWYQENFWNNNLHPDDREWVSRLCQEATSHDEDHDIEYRMIAADGRVVWVRDCILIVRNESDRVSLRGHMFNVSDQKQIIEALTRSKAEFEAMFNSIPIGLVFADTKRNIVMTNPALKALFGYSDEELVGHTTEMFYADKKDFQAQGRHRYHTGSGASTQPYEIRYRRKDGSVFWSETQGTQVQDVNGTIIGFFAMFQDITERKQVEHALHDKDARIRMVIESALDAIIVVDDNSVISEWNPEAEAIFGWKSAEVIGLTLMETIIPERYRQAHQQGVKRLMATGVGTIAHRRTELTALNREGKEFPIELTVAPLQAGDTWTFSAFVRDLTKHKQAEAELAQSEASFRALAEESPNMIFINTQGRIVYANKACEQQLGYKREAFYAEDFDFLKLVTPESIALIKKKFQLHKQGKEIAPYEYKIITRDHRELSVIQATRLIEFQGKESILGIITDITERKRANDALRESENKFRQAFENAALGICIFGLDGQFNKVNHSLCQLLGYSEAEMLSMSFSDVTHPDDIQLSRNKRRQLLSGETENAWYEKRYVHKQGQTVWVMLSTTLLYDERGEPIYFVTQAQDITERKQTEEALRSSERELSAILNAMQDAYYRADNRGHVVRTSPSIEKILGYTPKEIKNTKLADLYVEPEGREKFLTALEEAGGKLQNYETQLRHKDGSVVWVSTNAQYLKDEQGTIIGIEGTTRDVSQIKSAEDLSSRFGRILDNSSNEIYIFDVENMYFTLVNKGALQNLGYTMQEMERLTPADLKPDYTKESFKELIQPLLKGEQEEIIFQTRHIRKNGTIYPVEVRLQLSRYETPPVFVTIIQDITKRIQAEERLQFLAHHDALTSLPNRVLFADRLNQSIARARRHKHAAAVLFLDLDRFKLINDTLGHDFGDRALQSLAERLASCVRDGDTVARLGGDEFAVVLEDIETADDVAPTARKILDALAQSFMLDDREFFITTSIGISLFPIDGEDTQTLLKHADIAMYRSKDLGRNTYQFYSSDMSVRTFERLSLETSLRHALEREEFLLHYQPQFDLQTGKIVGVEALLRWQHPDLGLIMPADFIPLLEDTGLIAPVGEWVLRTACSEVQAWNQTELKPVRVAVNISSRQFNEPDFTQIITNILRETGLKPSLLELEITETVLMQNVVATVKTLEDLSEMGVRFSIDDFGTGYSSLSYLKRFPIDTLKIDQTFIHDMIENPEDAILVEAIIALGRALHLNVVAEGAETEAHIKFLKRCGCDCIQGYVFCPPLPLQQMLKRLK